ncbi:MAG: adenylate/guanylate cyclase domain-containing protein [Reyranellaceae bacterium]
MAVPFGVTLLALMAMIVLPLTGWLMWLGWRAVDQLEATNIEHRMGELDASVEGIMATGLRVVVAVGSTMAASPDFAMASATSADDQERLRQFAAVLRRYPSISAVFVGYRDGRFLYAGRPETFSPEQRALYDGPHDAPAILRIVDGADADRRETWWFETREGQSTAKRSRPFDFDPRKRPWYVDALAADRPVLTDPYRFAPADVLGISAGIPIGSDGVMGFDFTLDSLSLLIGDYRITPNSIIMIASEAGAIFMESEACRLERQNCLSGEGEVRAAMRRAVGGFAGRRVEEDVVLAGRDYRLLVHTMASILGRNYVIAAAVPYVELAAESHALMRRAGIAAAVAVALAAAAALLAAWLLSRSIARIALKTERIRQLDFSDDTPIKSRISEIVRLSESIERMRSGLEVFGRYVSKNLVSQIMRSPESAGLGGTRRDITVMFSDIEGFSRLSETMEPELLTSRLSRYFDVLGAAITANRGTIDKYIGDSIMAFWNAPEPDPDHIANAVQAALQCAADGARLSIKWKGRGRAGFRTRFGLHTGPAVVGNVGARERINYTLVGAVANQASRLEGLNKIYGTEILASGEVALPTAERFAWRYVDRIVAAGTTEVHEVYEPLGGAETVAEHADFLALWQEAQAEYAGGHFAAAGERFATAAALRPDDPPCKLFIERCRRLAADGPPAGWDGVWHFDAK